MPETVVCVGAIVRNGSRVLLVRQAAGHSLAGQWTIPWGRLEQGESAAAAAIREVIEESCVTAKVEALLGVQELPPQWSGWLALVYQCQHVSGEPAPDGRETDAAMYFSEAEMNSLQEPIEPWSEWLVRRVFSGKVTLTRSGDTTNPFGAEAGFL
jgi:ADP-ribose pyrophosphatase YjhB (NUDIX family)